MQPQVKKLLDKKKIEYSTINHSTAYTASQTAQSAHIPGRQLAKVVMLKLDGDLAMAVVPAHVRLDLKEIQDVADAKKVELAHEYEFNEIFPDCEVGAMPPFGNLWNMNVYIADSLTHEDKIAFNAGTHTELLEMSADDYLELVKPETLPNI